MLTPRLRRRLSELARTPPPPTPWEGARGGACPAPPAAALPAPPPSPSSSPNTQSTHFAGTPAPSAQLLLLPFDPPSLGAEAETEFGRCFRLTVGISDHLEDSAERSERLRAAA